MNKILAHITASLFAVIVYLNPLPVQANALLELTNDITRDVVGIVGEETRRGLAELVSGTLLKQADAKNAPQGSLRGRTFVIDAGHGGHNPGAVYHGSREADNNLAIAKKLATVLGNKGAKVIMTRTDDNSVAPANAPLREELLARTAISQQHKADLFISLHNNAAADQSLHGAMTFFYKDKEKKAAEAIHRALINEVKMLDKGVLKGDYLVLRENERPSVLLELGFISNENEAEKLKDNIYQNKLAYAIGKGIENYYKS